MPSECKILFDHPDGVYNSGDILNGNIVLTTSNSKTIRGVSIQLNGYAKVRWTESRGSDRSSEIFWAFDQYLNTVEFVMGEKDGQPFELLPGKYNHTFTTYLPPGLPTSCHAVIGEIKYEIILRIDRPYMFDNVFKQAFTVIQPLDINLEPTLNIPLKLEGVELNRCGCSCFGGDSKISAELNIPFGCYTPGQKIQFQLFVYNNSNSDVQLAELKLRKDIVCVSRSPSRKERTCSADIVVKKFGEILRWTRKEFKDFIEVPSIAPSSTDPEQIVRIEYVVMGKVKTRCCTINIVLPIPIKIGTVPMMKSGTNEGNIITMQPTASSIDRNNGGSYMSVAPVSNKDSLSTAHKFVDDACDEKHKC